MGRGEGGRPGGGSGGRRWGAGGEGKGVREVIPQRRLFRRALDRIGIWYQRSPVSVQ